MFPCSKFCCHPCHLIGVIRVTFKIVHCSFLLLLFRLISLHFERIRCALLSLQPVIFVYLDVSVVALLPVQLCPVCQYMNFVCPYDIPPHRSLLTAFIFCKLLYLS